MNEEDRKYLKNNIEKKLDNIEKTVSSNKPSNSETGKKLSELYKGSKERDERQQLFEELKKKNDNGEATLAQKIELMNQTIKASIPDDFKDAVKDTGKIMKSMGADMKKGASRSMQGVDSLITRIMNINPLTGMLWATGKGISKDLWNIGSGVAQAGFGVAKGIGKGVLNAGKGVGSIFNAAVNMFQKKEKPAETPEEEIKQEDYPRLSNPNTEELENEDYEKSTAKKISEIHAWIFKDFRKHNEAQIRAEQSRTNILSKGLSGLGKTMQAVNGFVEMIQAKQKLIVKGVLLGAIAIAGLAAWFKSDGFRKVLQGIVPAIINGVKNAVSGLLENASNGVDDIADTAISGTSSKTDTIFNQSFAGLNTEGVTSMLTKQYGGNKTSLSKEAFHDDGKTYKWMGDKIKALKKNKLIDKATNRLLEDPKHNWKNFNASVKNYTNTKEGHVLRFPVKIKMLDAEFNEDGTSSVLIEKAEMKQGWWKPEELNKFGGEVDKYVSHQMPRLVITRVQKILVPNRKVLPKNTPFVVVSKNYQIIGDVSAFMDEEDYGTFQNNTAKMVEGQANYIEFMNQKGMQEAYNKSTEGFNKKEFAKQVTINTGRDLIKKPLDAIHDALNDKVAEDYDPTSPNNQSNFDKASAPNPYIPKANLNNGNKNDNKVQTQQQQLAEQDKQIRQQQQIQQPTQSMPQTTPQTISIQGNNGNGGGLPPNLLDTNQALAAEDTYLKSN